MIDDQMLAAAFQQAKAADRPHIPPMAAILARAEYTREVRKRKQFTTAVRMVSALSAALSVLLIVLAPSSFPLPMSMATVLLLAGGGVATIWGLEPARLPRLS